MGEQDATHASPPTSTRAGRRSAETVPEVVAEAVQLLGWPGVTLPQVSLLDGLVHPVIALDLPAHHARQAVGQGPELDDDTLSIWEWPESAGRAPRPALQLSGMVVRARAGWAQGVRDAMRWRGFGPTAVLDVLRAAATFVNIATRARLDGTDLEDTVGEVVRLEAALDGIGLVVIRAPSELSGTARGGSAGRGPAGSGAARGQPSVAGRVLLAAEPGRRAPARRRVADRWLEEVLYRQALKLDLYADATPRR